MKFDGVAIINVSNVHGRFIQLVKRNPKFSKRTAHQEERFVVIATITKKQASALGNMLIINGAK